MTARKHVFELWAITYLAKAVGQAGYLSSRLNEGTINSLFIY